MRHNNLRIQRTIIAITYSLVLASLSCTIASPNQTKPLLSSHVKLFDNRPAAFLSKQNESKQVLPVHDGAIESKHNDKVPLLLRPWIHLYRSTPKLRIPRTNLDFAFTIASAIVLTCIDYGSAHLLVAAGWPTKSKHTRAVAGSIATIFHSSVLVLGLGAALSTQKYDPSGKMEQHPDWWSDGAHALIQFCTGYMIYDAAVQFIADRWQKGIGPVLSSADYMFLGHHAATSLYMISARLCEAGHMSAMILMFTGEFTAPIMNILRISRTATQATNEVTSDILGHSLLQRIHPYAEFLFAALYAGFRIVIGPICAAHLTYDILLTKKGRKNVPVGLSSVWLIMVWGVLIGSLPWIKNALSILQAGLNLSGGESAISSLDPE